MTFRGNHVDELISASLTGELTDAERLELSAHLVRCETCRKTLAAFTAERRILAGLPVEDPPRDLSARIRSGIEAGRGHPWWRRPGSLIAIGASMATVAAAVLAVVVFSSLYRGPVGQASGSPQTSVSFAPSSSAAASSAPSVEPTAAPTFLGPDELRYLSLNGAPFEPSRLTFINDATGASIDAGTVTGPPIAAALSPDGQWLAYITQRGLTGANEVWALHLIDGRVIPLGCSEAASFTDRLAWSPDGSYLAFTLIAVDLGSSSDCPADDGALGTSDAWVYDAANGERYRLTRSGNAYSASFMSGGPPATLLVSFAAESPWTVAVPLGGDPSNLDRIEGVFLPLVSPDGNRALFWSGTMAESGAGWQFSLGGMPQVSGDFRSTGPASPWIGTQLFTDLTPVGGEAFASGKFAWGPDSDMVAFWDGAWTGAPQSSNGAYPNQQNVYVGRISAGLLSSASRLGLIRPDDSFIVDVAFSSDGTSVAVTIGVPSAGVGDPPSAYLEIVPLDGSAPYTVGGGVEPPPWNGPAVYGY